MLHVAKTSATTPDPAHYRPTTEGWEEYKRQLPRVLQHLTLKNKQPTVDADEFIRALPWPLTEGPMRGAFLIDGQYYYIPCKFRLQHNEPIYYETKQHWVAEVRSEHPGLPGRSTSTTKFRVSKKDGTFDMLLPFIPVPLTLEEFTIGHFKELGRDESYIIHEFLPHLTELTDRVELVRTLRERLRTNYVTDLKPLMPGVRVSYETDRDSIKSHQVELSVDIYAQLIFLLGSKKGAIMNPNKFARSVSQAIVSGRWSAKRVGESVRLAGVMNEDAVHEAMRTIVSRQPGTKALLVRQRQLFPDAYGFLCAAGTPDGADVGLKQPLCIYARVNLATRRLERNLWGDGERWGPWVSPGEYVAPLLRTPPSGHLGYLAAQTPFAEHDQGARHQLAVGQRKQFMTAVPVQLQAPNGPLKHQMMCGQTPLVQVQVPVHEPSGVNVLVALVADPMNQEDGLVVNEAALQRGLFRSLAFHRHKLPTPLTPQHELRKRRRVAPGPDAPYLQRNEGGTVWSEAADGTSITVCTDTPLRVGDKLSNRHGQKGVVCEVRPAVDMPFVASGPMAGCVPDLLVNGAMAIPSRMTIGMLLEMAEVRRDPAEDEATRAGTHRGQATDRAPRELSASSETVTLRDGRTGELLPGEIMMGMCWYGRMEQLAAGKALVRTDKGPRDPLLGAPVRGRKAGGGLKWGTMEYNAAIAHGAVEIVRERTRDTCDPTTALYCPRCLQPSLTPKCATCHRRCESIETSRATELMLNELACQGVCAQLTLT